MDKNNPNYLSFPFIFPIHAKGSTGGKKAWEEENGTQERLLDQVMTLIESRD
jgi:hypothetical protein